MFVVDFLQEFYNIKFDAFSITGHQLMTLMITFLIISKVNLSYDRYMSARTYIGHALLLLRELNQTILMISKTTTNFVDNQNDCSNPITTGGGGGSVRNRRRQSPTKNKNNNNIGTDDSIQRWRVEVRHFFRVLRFLNYD